jgi:hypothetical protein
MAGAYTAGERDLVLISWDGQSPLHQFVMFDAVPGFDILTFDYSGSASTPLPVCENHFFLSRKTECKGQIYDIAAQFLERSDESYRFVGLIDDDIVIKLSDINFLLHVAGSLGLHSVAPSLTHDSFFTYRHTLRQHKRLFHPVPWVEVMMPFYRVDLFRAAAPFFRHSISSWGFDVFVMPMFQKLTKMERTAIIDAVSATHMRPIQSGGRVYSNGLTAIEEMEKLRHLCIAHMEKNHPELVGGEWFEKTFLREIGDDDVNNT